MNTFLDIEGMGVGIRNLQADIVKARVWANRLQRRRTFRDRPEVAFARKSCARQLFFARAALAKEKARVETRRNPPMPLFGSEYLEGPHVFAFLAADDTTGEDIATKAMKMLRPMQDRCRRHVMTDDDVTTLSQDAQRLLGKGTGWLCRRYESYIAAPKTFAGQSVCSKVAVAVHDGLVVVVVNRTHENGHMFADNWTAKGIVTMFRCKVWLASVVASLRMMK